MLGSQRRLLKQAKQGYTDRLESEEAGPRTSRLAEMQRVGRKHKLRRGWVVLLPSRNRCRAAHTMTMMPADTQAGCGHISARIELLEAAAATTLVTHTVLRTGLQLRSGGGKHHPRYS